MRVRIHAPWSVPSLVLFAALAAGCAPKPDAKAPESGAAAGPTAAPATAESVSSPPTTTTATLPDGSNPGTKLSPANAAGTAPTDSPGKKGSEAGRSREDIQAIIVARRDDARACYDMGLKTNPAIEGDLDIKWTIDPDGNVTDAGADSARSTIRDDGVISCIVAVIKKIKFAKSAKGFETRTHYPYNFHPKPGQVGRGAGGSQPPTATPSN